MEAFFDSATANWLYTPYMLIALLGALVAVGIAIFSWKHRAIAGVPYFIGLTTAVAWWCFFYALEMYSTQLPTMTLFAQLQYLGITTTPVFWFLFVMTYNGRLRAVSWRSLLPFFVMPLITVLLAFTNGAHHLIWATTTVDPEGPFVAFVSRFATWFWLHTAYSYALMFLGSLMMTIFLWRSRAMYRGQAAVLLAGCLFPWLGNLAYLSGWVPVPHLDLTPLVFAISGLLMALGLFRFRLLDVTPVARRVVVDSMQDAMLALDLQDRVVDVNPAAEALLGLGDESILGESFGALLPTGSRLLEYVRGRRGGSGELEMTLGEQSLCYDVRLSPLYDQRQRPVGRLLVLRDITKRKKLEASLERQVARFEQLLTVARATTEQPNLESTLQNTLDTSVALTSAERGSIFLVDDRGVPMESILARGEVPLTLAQELVENVMAKGLVGWVIRQREVVVVGDVSKDARWLNLPEQPYRVGSALGVPITQGDRMLGALILLHPEHEHFTGQDAEVMAAAVQQMALAIRNAKIYEEQRRMADQQVILNVVLRSLQRLHTLEQVVQNAVEVISRLTGWPQVTLLTPDNSGQRLYVEATAGELAMASDWTVPISHPIIEPAWQTAMLQTLPEIGAGETLPGLEKIVSLFIVPVMQDREVHWLLLIGSDVAHAFDPDAHLLAESLVEVISLVMRNARLYVALQNELGERQRAEERLRRTLRRTETLYQISRSLIGTYEHTEILRAVVDAVVGALDADEVFLALVDSETHQLVSRVTGGTDIPEVAAACFDDVMDGLTGWVMREGEALLFPDDDLPLAVFETVDRECSMMGVGSLVIAPLLFRAQTFYGVLAAVNQLGRHEFTPEDLNLMVAIAAQIAVAVRNLWLFQEVAEQQRRLQALVRASRDGVILIGMDLHILVINQPALDYLQLDETPEGWVNRPLWDAMALLRTYAPRVVRVMVREMRRVRVGDEPPSEGEYTVGHRILHWLNLPVQGDEQALGRLIILQDVTDARSIEKMREDLTHTMVHDLRNPITGIDGALQLLARVASQLPENYREVMEIAQSSTRRMLKLVNAILDISRLESGRMPLKLTVFPFSEVLREVLTLEQTLAQQRGVALEQALDADAGLVRADAGLISRVLQNLVDNALKFTPAGGRVRVSTWLDADDPDALYVAVSDTGLGIPPELRSRLFQKFVTGEMEGRGSGLGLAFCKMVVEAHGGQIWVDSKVGEGTTFTFTVPLASSRTR